MANVQISDNQSTKVYNARALVRCEASYLGAALPTKTTQPPGIIHEPLEKICEKENLPTLVNTAKKPVRLHIFHSGIMIELLFGKHNGELVWYPIQNLYCSAGLQPLKTKHGPLEFRTLDDQAAGKSSLKPIFAVVFRETVQKKVLQCHAFSITRKELAQLLVQATSVAYRDKFGWNQPLNSLHFGTMEYGHTLNIADEIHTDSGYSDHDESSLKGEQSPHSSELSAGNNSNNGNNLDNQNTQKPKPADFPILSQPPLLTTPSSSNIRTSPQSSPTSSQTSATFCGFQSDLFPGHSGDERSSIRSTKSTSLSSGYPLSRDSSLATGDNHVTPSNTTIQRMKSPFNLPRQHTSNANSTHMNGDRINIAPLESLRSLSLSQSTVNSQASNDQRFRRLHKGSTIEVINLDGIPRQVVHHKSGSRSSLPKEYYHQGGRVGQQYYHHQPLTYTQYHPDQFMYGSDHYLTNETLADSNQTRSKEKPKSSSKELKKKATKNIKNQMNSESAKDIDAGYTSRKLDAYNHKHLSMEGRLTKKSIPRQLL